MIEYFSKHVFHNDTISDAVSLINNHNLQRNNYLNSYIEAINSGSNCFWCIPTTDEPSQYIAFSLMNNSKNDTNLIAAQHIAKNQKQDALFVEIREFTVRQDVQKGYLESKGWLIDCKDFQSASSVYKVLLNFMPHTFGYKRPENFCRIVLQEFGKAYMKVQLHINQKDIALKSQPCGPKYNYKDCKPSIDAMIEYFNNYKDEFYDDSMPPGVSQINKYLNLYVTAINFGSNCFWCIPEADRDSKYVGFVLLKNIQNDQNLIAAQQIAKNQRNDVQIAEIREWTLRNNAKKGYWKSKGWIIDCKRPFDAYNIYKVLSNFIPHTFGESTPANFCRIVLEEFGDAYMKVQLLSMGQNARINNELKNKPFGPKYNYENSKPSIIAMNESPNEVIPCEYDFGPINDDTTITNETQAKYDDFSHMK
eukprot:434194_1